MLNILQDAAALLHWQHFLVMIFGDKIGSR